MERNKRTSNISSSNRFKTTDNRFRNGFKALWGKTIMQRPHWSFPELTSVQSSDLASALYDVPLSLVNKMTWSPSQKGGQLTPMTSLLDLPLNHPSFCLPHCYIMYDIWEGQSEVYLSDYMKVCHTECLRLWPYKFNLMFNGSANSVSVTNKKKYLHLRVHQTWGRGYVVTSA